MLPSTERALGAPVNHPLVDTLALTRHQPQPSKEAENLHVGGYRAIAAEVQAYVCVCVVVGGGGGGGEGLMVGVVMGRWVCGGQGGGWPKGGSSALYCRKRSVTDCGSSRHWGAMGISAGGRQDSHSGFTTAMCASREWTIQACSRLQMTWRRHQ